MPATCLPSLAPLPRPTWWLEARRLVALRRNIRSLPKYRGGGTAAVQCVDTGQHFGSMTEAGESVGSAPQNIYYAIKHGTRCGGKRWKRVK